jgi:hypothetical protein
MNELKGITQKMGSERYTLEHLITDRERKYD